MEETKDPRWDALRLSERDLAEMTAGSSVLGGEEIRKVLQIQDKMLVIAGAMLDEAPQGFLDLQASSVAIAEENDKRDVLSWSLHIKGGDNLLKNGYQCWESDARGSQILSNGAIRPLICGVLIARPHPGIETRPFTRKVASMAIGEREGVQFFTEQQVDTLLDKIERRGATTTSLVAVVAHGDQKSRDLARALLALKNDVISGESASRQEARKRAFSRP